MSQVIAAIRAHAEQQPDAIALQDATRSLSYRALALAIDGLAIQLKAAGVRTLALHVDNGLAWALADLAVLAAGLRIVPLPLFFSAQQQRNAIESAGADALLIDPALPLAWSAPVTSSVTLEVAGRQLQLQQLAGRAVTLPLGTQKITFTSGTTGSPKGVCLSLATMEGVAQALCEATAAGPDDVHLCVLPLPTLLENLGGLYAPLLAGARVCVPDSETVGLSGASGFDPLRCLNALRWSKATTTILVPQLLQALVTGLNGGMPRPEALRFVAVGGAPMAQRLLDAAARHALPVFEGYGLSECASVVALNTCGRRRAGSVGRPLPHQRIRIAADGEIHVAGSTFLGHVGDEPRRPADEVATGDLGHLDADGYLFLTGRKKNMFVTSFGRNVAPEWVERELTSHAAIAQAAVFGEARPWNLAVIVASPGYDAAAVDHAVDACNRELPDYARIRRWIAARAPFLPINDQATANGRLRRRQIAERYRDLIDQHYEEDIHDVVS